MANDEHLAVLSSGVGTWNEWRQRNLDVTPDLVKANLAGANLDGANLWRANLPGVNLRRASLDRANLVGANLESASLDDANVTAGDLRNVNLSHAQIRGACLLNADLTRANLQGAYLLEADLKGATLLDTNLRGAFFQYANLHHVRFGSADFRDAHFGDTIFGDCFLDQALGLNECSHLAPSVIDFKTLSRFRTLPIGFLRGCGLPDQVIEYLPALCGHAIQFYSCFISYSSSDQMSADRLYADLQNKGVRCWFAPHDLPIGAKTWDAIDEAIRLHDKLIVILSDASISSDWVEDEVNKAYEEERVRKQNILFPIRIDNAVMSTIEPWATKLRNQRNIGDFRQWASPVEYNQNLERLLRDLKTAQTPRDASFKRGET